MVKSCSIAKGTDLRRTEADLISKAGARASGRIWFFDPGRWQSGYVSGSAEMHQVLHGDRVLVREAGKDFGGRREAKIVEVLEHVNQRLVAACSVSMACCLWWLKTSACQPGRLGCAGSKHGGQRRAGGDCRNLTQPNKNSQPVAG